MRDGEKEGNRRSLNWKYTILVTDAIHLSLISHLSFFVILIPNSCYFVGIAATMLLLLLLQMGDLYRKLSLAQLICFAHCKTVIIFISFVSHDLNLSAIRFRRFVNDFVVCCCVISIWGWIWYTNKQANQIGKYHFPESDFATDSINTPRFTCSIVLLNEKKWKQKSNSIWIPAI